ncbi:MAG: nucleotidyltransferase family protein [Rothia sp. (in: high G+C Gram-positive bacteria)]|nr:nucleotidyltransferase family protein [Rothia sp. (in: high G+C Gram-positive bacteria)]
MTDSSAGTVTPLSARIRLSHAYFQRLADANGIDLLHVKGYAFGEEVFRPGRSSTDVDVLVRPGHLNRLMYLLQADGWRILTHFETGSIFEHAATLYHPVWGLTDVHRYFPGIGFADPAASFEQLWQGRRKKLIAHYPCSLPSLLDCRVITVVHSARSKDRYRFDVTYLQQTLSRQDWSLLRQRAQELDAELAFDTALGQLSRHRGQQYYLLWKAASQQVPAYQEWFARIERRPSIRGKIRVLLQIFTVNNDHLAMSLGHSPSRGERRQKFFKRFKRLWGKQ